MTKYQELESAIRKACGDTMKLEFGCSVRYKNEPERSVWKVQHVDLRNGLICLVDCFITRSANKDEIEILGRELTLADVLRAIDEATSDDNNTWYAVDSSGQFARQENNCESELTDIFWDLSKTYSQQTDATKDFLYSIICK